MRLLGAAIGLAVGVRALGPTLAAIAFLVMGIDNATFPELTLRVIVVGGRDASCLGAAALSARVIRFAAGGLRPVSASFRFAPPMLEAGAEGAMSWDAVRRSSLFEGGGGPRIEGRLRIGEVGGEVVLVRRMFGDFSPKGILLGEGIFEES